MVDLNCLLEFSHTYCVSICAVLVPLNLLATSGTLILTGLGGSARRVWQSCGFACLCAGLMVLHVGSWFIVGVVMLPTFVLLLLGSVCLATNLWAIGHPASLRRLLRSLTHFVRRSVASLRPSSSHANL
jgi:hypothetical protein